MPRWWGSWQWWQCRLGRREAGQLPRDGPTEQASCAAGWQLQQGGMPTSGEVGWQREWAAGRLGQLSRGGPAEHASCAAGWQPFRFLQGTSIQQKQYLLDHLSKLGASQKTRAMALVCTSAGSQTSPAAVSSDGCRGMRTGGCRAAHSFVAPMTTTVTWSGRRYCSPPRAAASGAWLAPSCPQSCGKGFRQARNSEHVAYKFLTAALQLPPPVATATLVSVWRAAKCMATPDACNMHASLPHQLPQ